MPVRLAAAVFGGAFGFLLAWARVTDPDAIRRMLLLEDLYLFGVMGTSTAVAFVGMRLLRRAGARALLTGEPLSWTPAPLERRHVVGSAIFGVGWGVANTCPGPVAAQLGQGAMWSLLTIAGIVVGIRLRDARVARRGREHAPAVPTRA